MSGAEYEFFNFRVPAGSNASPVESERNSSATAVFLNNNPADKLPHLTEGMTGYSVTRPVHNQDWFYSVFNTCEAFRCGIEGWHTESGPGVLRLHFVLTRSKKLLIEQHCSNSRSNLFQANLALHPASWRNHGKVFQETQGICTSP